MKFLKLFPIIFTFLGLFTPSNLIYAEDKDPNSYKVLSSKNKKLNCKCSSLYKGRRFFVESGDFEEAKKSYDNARDLAKQLAHFIET